MTSQSISDVLAAQITLPAQAERTNAVSNKENAQFASLMNGQSQNLAQGSLTESYRVTGVAGVSEGSTKLQYQYSDKTKIKSEEADMAGQKLTVTKEEAEQTASEFEDRVKDLLEEKLGVTEDDIEQAMEDLGLTYGSLLQPENLSALTAELMNCEDPSELLLNPEFTEVMQGFAELTAEFTEEAGIDLSEFAGLLEFAEEMPEEEFPGQPEVTEKAGQEEIPAGNVTVQTAGNAADTAKTSEAVKEPDRQTVTEEPEDEPVPKAAEETAEAEDAGETGEDSSRTGEETESETLFKEQQKSDNGKMLNTQSAAENVTVVRNDGTVQGQQVNTENVQNMPASQQTVDVEEIMKQISEFARVNITSETSSVEMQLNPENLGKVYIHVTEKEGSITAQIQAQSEAVKEALETQVAALKETLEGQGVKVTSVEVTIASHEFEQNLEQNSLKEEQQGSQENQNQSGGRRNINLNELDSLSGVMTEEEELVAKIMKENGNSVDLTA